MAKADPTQFETQHMPTWCSGCGDFGIWRALKKALAAAGVAPHACVVVFGIGCAGNMADKLRAYGFHGLHGRALPVAEGIKLANHKLPVLVVAGDGDGYGEGMAHFIHSARANHDVTYLVYDNAVYGLTKGQTAPTSPEGFISSSTPAGVVEQPVHPLALALAAGATFVARGFAGAADHLAQLIVQGMEHRGFALIDILQPCVTFNHLNTYEFYRERVYQLSATRYKPTDRQKAMEKALEWDAKIPLGVLYQSEERPAYHERESPLAAGPLVDAPLGTTDVAKLWSEFF